MVAEKYLVGGCGGFSFCLVSGFVSMVSSRRLVLVWAPPVPCISGWLWESSLLGGVGFLVLVWFLILFSLVGPDATAGCGILMVVWAPSGSGVGCKFWFWLVLA